jgi:hypothetical protein
MISFRLNFSLILIGLCFLGSGCRAKVSSTEISIAETDEKLPIVAKNTEQGFRGFFFESSEFVIPADYLKSTWENHVGSSIGIEKGNYRVLFIDIFKDPLPEAIDDEFGYKLIVQYSPASRNDTIIFTGSSNDRRAVAHYFHFGPGDSHCWWMEPKGKVEFSSISARRLDGQIDLMFMPEPIPKRIFSPCRSVSFRGKFSVPRRYLRYLFFPGLS